jgi:hypothetical protein
VILIGDAQGQWLRAVSASMVTRFGLVLADERMLN